MNSPDRPSTHTAAGPPPGHAPTADGDDTGAAEPARDRSDTDYLAPPQSNGELGRLAHYRVLRQLGAGGMGVVFEAEDTTLDRRVALKVMKGTAAATPVARERFLREAKAAAAVKHDHIVTIYQVGEDRGVPFIALEFLHGVPLDAWLRAHPRPTVVQALRVGREVAEGLAAAHARGLVHRDIKPANVWLEAPKGRVKILDFGLARAANDDTHLTREGAVVGTPAFMSPEQARGAAVDHRTDLFSLGVMLYRMLTGVQPFTGPSTMAVLTSLAVDTPTPVRERNPDVPPALAELVHKLLSKDAAGRPSSAADVAAECRRIDRELSGRGVAASGPMPVVIAPPAAAPEAGPNPFELPSDKSTEAVSAPAADGVRKRRRPWVLVGGVVGLGVLAAVLIWSVLPGEVHDTPQPSTEISLKPPVKGGKAVALTGSPVQADQQPHAARVPSSNVIDLLPLIEPVVDKVRGAWVREGNSIVGKGGGSVIVIEIPYHPPDEYDVIAEFRRTIGSDGVGLALNRAGSSFNWCAAVHRNRFGFSRHNGKLLSNDPSSIRPKLAPENDRIYTTKAEVRRDRVIGYFEGQIVDELETDYSNLSQGPDTQLRDPSLLGLTAYHSTIVFHRLEVVEVTGRGKFSRPTPSIKPDGIQAGTRWAGRKNNIFVGDNGNRGNSKLELVVTDRKGKAFNGVLEVSGEKLDFKVTVEGSITRDEIEFMTQKNGKFQHSFSGHIRGDEIDLTFSGTGKAGEQIKGDTKLRLQELRSPDSP